MKWIRLLLIVCLLPLVFSPTCQDRPVSAQNYSGTANKGLLGEQDIQHFDGTNSGTFLRQYSFGYPITLTKVGNEVDVLAAYGGGFQYTAASINLAITAIGSESAMLVLRPGAWTFPTSIPSNIGIKVKAGTNILIQNNTTISGPCVVDGGGTFTNFRTPPINTIAFGTPIQAGMYPIFNNFDFTQVSGPMYFYPQWFGSSPAYPISSKSGNYTIQVADGGTILQLNSPNACNFTLPVAASCPTGWSIKLQNVGTGVLTIIGTVNGSVNPKLNQYDEVTIVSDGAYFYGKSTTYAYSEYSATSANNSTSLLLGAVNAGDRILVSGLAVFSSGTNADVGVQAIQSAGNSTATVNYGGYTTQIQSGAYLKSSGGSVVTNPSGVIQVTGAGNLTLQGTISTGGTATVTTHNLYAFFLNRGGTGGSGGGGSANMMWPTGAGAVNFNGTNWGDIFNSSNPFPANYIPSLPYQGANGTLNTYAATPPTVDAQTLLGHSFAQMKNDLSITPSVANIGNLGSAINIAWSTASMQYGFLNAANANCAVNFVGAVAGQKYTLYLCQLAAGNGNATFANSIRWQSGNAPTISSGANNCTAILLHYLDSTMKYFGVGVGNF